MLSTDVYISVIIPLFNKELTIKDTVLSVLNQEHKNFELLIIDDGSTDSSVSVLLDLKDARMSILSKPNGGVSDTRNFGVKNSKYDYIFFLDADDLIVPSCLSGFTRLISKHPEISVFTSNFKMSLEGEKDVFYCREKREGIITNSQRALFERRIFPRTGSMILKKTCFEEVGYFKTHISLREDLEFILRVLNQYTVCYTPRILFNYQRTFNSLSVIPVPVSKDFSFYSSSKNKPFFERLILAYNVFDSLRTRLRRKDWDGSNYLFRKLIKQSTYFIFSVFYLKTLNLFYRIRP